MSFMYVVYYYTFYQLACYKNCVESPTTFFSSIRLLYLYLFSLRPCLPSLETRLWTSRRRRELNERTNERTNCQLPSLLFSSALFCFSSSFLPSFPPLETAPTAQSDQTLPSGTATLRRSGAQVWPHLRRTQYT